MEEPEKVAWDNILDYYRIWPVFMHDCNWYIPMSRGLFDIEMFFDIKLFVEYCNETNLLTLG